MTPLPPRLDSEDLLQYYLVEEEHDGLDTRSEEKKFMDNELDTRVPFEKPTLFLGNNLEETQSSASRLPDSMAIEDQSKTPQSQMPEAKAKDSPNLKGEAFPLQGSGFPCNCKKSKCLKLYCECFSKGRLCSSLCNCTDCCNREPDCKLRKLALRNTYLKSHKADKDTEDILDLDLQSFVMPNSSSRSLGCNCRKSHCKKKYCECFDEGKACGNMCKCEGCKNYLGVRVRGKKERGGRKAGNNAVVACEKK